MKTMNVGDKIKTFEVKKIVDGYAVHTMLKEEKHVM